MCIPKHDYVTYFKGPKDFQLSTSFHITPDNSALSKSNPTPPPPKNLKIMIT